MAAAGAPGLSNTFNFASKALLWLSLSLLGAVLFDPVTLTLGHFNSGGMEAIAELNPYFQNFYDSTGITDLLHQFAAWLRGDVGSAISTGSQLLNSGAGPVFIPPGA